jgi:UDP-N-acetyl-D-glucosamine/UDP-N-acetyl-D-galactosamine dehydrogenase
MERKHKIAVIGLGYVGLPLAVEFAKKYPVIGFDTNSTRINELMSGIDRTAEIENDDLKQLLTTTPGSKGLFCSDKPAEIAACNYFIVTVPTPTDRFNYPDLTQLYKASEMIGMFLKKADIVIYESTVYPGVTEEECVPVLEKTSGLKFNDDFYCGYSPERINPGDKLHSLSKIIKITSGSTPKVAKEVDALYGSIIEAGTYLAPSIKVAEAAKVIENSQRDINIAFVNELAKIFNLLGIDTMAVLEAAGTKWNFHHFKPGLVGGHCIGIAPNYLARKAEQAGYIPEIIRAGRRINDSMGVYVAGETVKWMVKKDIPVKEADVLILGFTFKENCPDTRNTRVTDIITELQIYQATVHIFDPWVEAATAKKEHGIDLLEKIDGGARKYDAVILAVGHEAFKEINIRDLVKPISVVYDVKGLLDTHLVDARL